MSAKQSLKARDDDEARAKSAKKPERIIQRKTPPAWRGGVSEDAAKVNAEKFGGKTFRERNDAKAAAMKAEIEAKREAARTSTDYAEQTKKLRDEQKAAAAKALAEAQAAEGASGGPGGGAGADASRLDKLPKAEKTDGLAERQG